MNSIYSFFLSILFSTLSFFTSAQINIEKSPKWVKEHDVNLNLEMEEYEGKTSDGQLYILIDAQDNIKEQTKYRHHAYKLLTTKGVQNYSEISVSYDPTYERLFFHKLTIIRDGRIIDKLNVSKFNTIQKEESSESLIYDGSLTSYIMLDDVRINDIIEYSFSIHGFNPLLKGKFSTYRYLEYEIPVAEISYSLIVPNDRPIFIKNHNTSIEASIVQSKSEKYFSWKIKKSFGIIQEDNLPSWYKPYAAISITQYKDWPEMGRDFTQHYIFNSNNDQIKEVFNAIWKKSFNKEDYINKAISYAQNDIRYLGLEEGISGYKPRPPQKIIQQRFGDCKDKSLLLVALLKQAGIESKAVLINTYYKDRVSDLLPSPESFNHCVVKINFADTTLWIDPTIREQGGDFNKKYFPNYGKGLVLDKDKSELASIPTSQISKVHIEEKLDISSLNDDHDFEVATTYFGNDADNQKKIFLDSNVEEISSDYVDYYSKYYGEVRVYEKLSYTYDDTLNIFTVFEHYKIKNIWGKSSVKDFKLQAEIFNTNVSTFYDIPSTRNRKMPFRISYPNTLEVKTIVKLPDEWDKDNMVKKIEGPGVLAYIERNYIGNIAEFIFNLKTTNDQIEPNDISSYINNTELIKENEGRIYYFSPDSKKTSSFDLSDTNTLPSFTILGLIILGIAGRLIYYNFNPRVSTDNATNLGIGGWLILPAIGIILTPTVLVIEIFQANMTHNLISLINSVDFKGIVLLLHYIFTIILFSLSILLLFLFFKKRTNVPYIIIIFYAFNLISKGLVLMLTKTLNIETIIDLKTIIAAITACIIWIPYFLYSDRVKHTFTYRI